MTHDDPQVIDALAAEYVLGTLRGPARKRFEEWRDANPLIDRRVNAWEDRFVHLALALPPVMPSPKTWEGIERRISAKTQAVKKPVPWRALAAAIVLFAVVGSVIAVWQTGLFIPMSPLVTIAAKDGSPLWRIDITDDHVRMRAEALSASAAHPGKSLELWALPDGKAPVSLGVLPDNGKLDRELTVSQREALRNSAKVAVSLEPRGGSPTGAPTGPVLFVAEPVRA
jgi:anti-sigma-K factor RskA